MIKKPEEVLNLEKMKELALGATDEEWREMRIYFRKKDGKPEIRFNPELRITRFEGERTQ